ncbi:BMA-SPDL-1 [Dirofilaria immitis]|nr:BMA-SPDL-1 [Dirofilaria immitis]
MGRLPGSKNKILKNAVSSDEISIKGNKRSYVRHHCKNQVVDKRSNQPKLVFSLLEKLTKEVQTLSMEVVEFERRAQDRYRSLIDEHFNLRKQVTGLRRNYGGEKYSIWNKMANPLMRELERNINGTFDETDDEEKRDEAVGAKDSTIDANELNNKPRKRRAAANKREEKKAKFLKKESDDGTDSENSNADSKEGTEISPWKMYKHIQIKPRPTDLPKPKIARSGGGRNVHFTDEWKRYATTVYPIDPSRYWNLPQAQYDLLIPTEKEHFIRSIYDWFRSQHRIAQLRVVLNECNSAIDFNDLWDVYVKEMKRRGWPVYGKRLRKGEVSTAKQQILEDFIDSNIQIF